MKAWISSSGVAHLLLSQYYYARCIPSLFTWYYQLELRMTTFFHLDIELVTQTFGGQRVNSTISFHQLPNLVMLMDTLQLKAYSAGVIDCVVKELTTV